MDIRDFVLASNKTQNDEAALATFGLYQSYVDAGFTAEQALDLVKDMHKTHMQTTMLLRAQQENPE